MAERPGDLPELLAELERAVRDGAWAYGFLSYEAAAGLPDHLPVADPDATVPLAWFGIGGPPARTQSIATAPGQRRYWTSDWRLTGTPDEHAAAVRRIQDEIAAGTVYQVNLTTRARGTVRGDLDDLYADLVHAQQAAYNAFLDLGDRAVISISPELFVEWTPPRLRCRPMKGTARRAGEPGADEAAGRRLSASGKDLAENVMIVDLVRNDLGRIAVPGSVHVPHLFVREPFGAVWQLSSDVAATPRPGTTVGEVLAALFPSGSITGAPKRAAMQVIRALEPEPRGVYCGAIGWLAPPDEPTRARFNVAIRTLAVDRSSGAAVYGTGGGITIDSDPSAEYQEMRDKLAVLSAVAEPLELLETFAFVPPDGFRHLDRHLARLAGSAGYFGIDYDEDAVRRALRNSVPPHAPARVGLRLGADGRITVAVEPLPPDPARPVRLALDSVPVDAESLWQRHKTSHRAVYDAARARHPRADDVVLVGKGGGLVETTIANLAVCLDGRWWTPPLESGCLPGVGRAVALDDGRLHERELTADDLYTCEGIALINSLRGWRPAALI